PRGVGCALGRARSWLLLGCRLSWRAEGVSLPASPGGHLCWRSWQTEPASLLALCGRGVSRRGRLTRAARARHPGLEYLSALLLFFELGSHCDHCLPEGALDRDRGVEEWCFFSVFQLSQLY